MLIFLESNVIINSNAYDAAAAAAAAASDLNEP